MGGSANIKALGIYNLMKTIQTYTIFRSNEMSDQFERCIQTAADRTNHVLK